MIKKVVSIFLVFTMMMAGVLTITPAGVISAAEPGVTISDVQVDFNPETNKMTVEGTISSGSGMSVTIRVVNPNGSVDYVGQTKSTENGAFEFVFTPYVIIPGTYDITVGGQGVVAPAEKEFHYAETIPTTGVSLDKKEATLKVGGTLTLTATVEPENATNKAVTWSSSNDEVATVDENGLVTAVAEGTADIIVTTVDGGHTDKCAVTVEKATEVVTISDVEVDVNYDTDKITVEGKVSSGGGKNVTIQVLDPDGYPDFVGQTTSLEDGSFTFVFTPNVKKTGDYTVKLGALGLATPFVRSFEYVYTVPVPVTGVSLDKEDAALKVGQFLALTATVEPADATNKAVTWSSSNDAVATVDANGLVTAAGEGTAIITVTTEDGGFTATCNITVEKVTEIVTIDNVDINLNHETGEVIVEGKISSGSGKEVTIQVLDPDGNQDYVGQTTSVEDGKFTFIFALYTQMEGNYTVKLGAVGVVVPFETTFEYKDEEPPVAVTGVSLDKEGAMLKVGDELQLTATVEPANADNKAVTWSSSNDAVATVDANGLVTAAGEGTAVITVTTEDGGFTATCNVTVEKTGTEVTISGVEVDVNHDTGKVTVEGIVSSGRDKEVTIVVLDPNGVEDFISQTTSTEGGKFTFVFTPNVQIEGDYTVKLSAWGVTTPYVTTFKYKDEEPVAVTGVSLDKEDATLNVGDELQLTATVEPANADNKAVNWSSSDNTVATVDENGLVTAVAEGTAVITVTTEDGGFTATCNITVEKVTEVVTISDVTTVIDPVSNKVTLEGIVSSGSGKEVTIKVYNPSGELDYVDQTTSVEGGKFTFVFTPYSQEEGTYTVELGAVGLEESFETTFEYDVEEDKPFDISPVGSLERVGGIWATVDVERVEGTSDHEGQEVVVFQLMKGNTPVAISAIKQDIESKVTPTAMFNVVDPENEEYTVEVFVFDKFDSDTGTAPVILAIPEIME